MRSRTGRPGSAASAAALVRAGRTMSVRRAVTWLLLGLVLFYVIRSPDHAAGALRSAALALGSIVSSLASFVSSLV